MSEFGLVALSPPRTLVNHQIDFGEDEEEVEVGEIERRYTVLIPRVSNFPSLRKSGCPVLKTITPHDISGSQV